MSKSGNQKGSQWQLTAYRCWIATVKVKIKIKTVNRSVAVDAGRQKKRGSKKLPESMKSEGEETTAGGK